MVLKDFLEYFIHAELCLEKLLSALCACKQDYSIKNSNSLLQPDKPTQPNSKKQSLLWLTA